MFFLSFVVSNANLLIHLVVLLTCCVYGQEDSNNIVSLLAQIPPQSARAVANPALPKVVPIDRLDPDDSDPAVANVPKQKADIPTVAASKAAAATHAAPKLTPTVSPTFLPPLVHQPGLAIREYLGHRRDGQQLSKMPVCRDVVRLQCNRAIWNNNFAVLECLQRDQIVAEAIPVACQNAIWNLKYNLTHDVEFEYVASGACQEDLVRLKECGKLPPRSGYRLACLIEHKANVTSAECRAYLRRLEPLVFADYRIVDHFIGACRGDIARTNCGRLEYNTGTGPITASKPISVSSQGQTVACLGRNVASVNHLCRTQLVRLAELQSSDYHNDRPLYYACRLDREHLCAAVTSGEGRILACLNRQRNRASATCEAELARVRTLAGFNYAVYRRFAGACRGDLQRLGCVHPNTAEATGSAVALLCLENALIAKGPTSVTVDCQTRMVDIRSDFITDPKMVPELSKGCVSQLEACRMDRIAEYGLLHCIMRKMREARDRSAEDGGTDKATQACDSAINRVLRIAMPTIDLRVDPVVMADCSGEIRVYCSALNVANVYACLKATLAARPDVVQAKCSDRLNELVYFENRDFRLNRRLYKACLQTAKKSCGARDNWWKQDLSKPQQGTGGHRPAAVIYNCLFSLMNQGRVDSLCAAQLTKSVHERADRSRLDVRLFAPCLTDLSKFCMQSRRPGEEFACLQDNLGNLRPNCSSLVRKITSRVDENPAVSPDIIFVQSCLPFIRKYCNRADGQVSLNQTVMTCLIEQKAHPQMDKRCLAGIEHHQIVALGDYRISHDFASACRGDIQKVCSSGSKSTSKVDIVRCLSQAARNDVLLNREQRLSGSCRRQLALELLQRRRLPQLDPGLARACKDELKTVCPLDYSPDPLACLRSVSTASANRLGAECRKKLFERDKTLLNVPVLDATLMNSCQRMISRHCSDLVSRPVKLYTCLRARMHLSSFDAQCYEVVNKRMMAQQKDYRLNPELQRYCGTDIDKFCAAEKAKADRRDSSAPSPSSQGAVTRCLREIIMVGESSAGKAGSAKQVGNLCWNYMRSLALEYNLNYLMEPRLASACKQVAEQYCHPELEDLRDSGGNGGILRVTECLKRLLAAKKIKPSACKTEVTRLFKEARADIHTDPLLYRACSSELVHLCPGIPLGGGRQMSCAISAFRDDSARRLIGSECAAALQQRLELMEAALGSGAFRAKSLSELAVHVNESPFRVYFFVLVLSLAALLLFVGFCTGRVTKRAAAVIAKKR